MMEKLSWFSSCTTNVQDFSPENIAHLVYPHAAVVLGSVTLCFWRILLLPVLNLKHQLDLLLSEWQLYYKQSLIW